MRIHIPYISDQNIGGGYTFYRNLTEALAVDHPDIQVVPESEPHDILLAFSPTTVNGETIERSKAAGAKFILRMDGVPEDSRNSGRGTRRMIEYALKADYIIYQSNFINRTVGRLIKANGVECPHAIIPNGVDTEIFRPDGEKIAFPGEPKILHIAYRKDPNKRYEEVVAMYREYYSQNKQANLLLLGRYPTEWMTYNMGFFNGERHQRLGIVTDLKAKAAMIRSCDLLFYPSFADPAPNVILEALACGVPILYQPYGGVHEVVGHNNSGMAIDGTQDYTYQIEAIIKNRDLFSQNARERILAVHTLPIMAAKYRNVFELVTGI